jgi:hypothetical protein
MRGDGGQVGGLGTEITTLVLLNLELSTFFFWACLIASHYIMCVEFRYALIQGITNWRSGERRGRNRSNVVTVSNVDECGFESYMLHALAARTFGAVRRHQFKKMDALPLYGRLEVLSAASALQRNSGRIRMSGRISGRIRSCSEKIGISASGAWSSLQPRDIWEVHQFINGGWKLTENSSQRFLHPFSGYGKTRDQS